MSIDFDTTGDLVDCGSDASIDAIFAGGGTIMAWIFPHTFGEDGEVAGRIMEKTGWHFYMTEPLVTDSFGFTRQHSSLGGVWTAPASSIVFNTRYHLAVTYNEDSNSNDALLYLNGVSQTVVEQVAPSGTPNADGTLFIGNRLTPNRTFDGLIEDCRLYDNILTPNRIANIYAQRGADSDRFGLKGRWRMNEGAPGTAASGTDSIKDSSPFGNHGTPTGSPLYDTGQLAVNRRR